MGFSNLELGSSVDTEDKDILPGGFLKESGLYKTKIKMAYDSKSAKGAEAVVLIFEDEDGREIRETIYVTNRLGEPTYKDKKGNLHALPGYNLVSSIFAVTGANPKTQEEKQVNIYNADAKKEIPQKAKVYSDLFDKPIILALLKVRENKNVKGPNGDYVPTNEERIFNSISKVFNMDTQRTSTEIADNVEDPSFIFKWNEKWKGRMQDKYKEVQGGGSAGMPPAGTGAVITTDDLF